MEVEEPEATSTVSQSSNQEVSMDAQPSTSRSGHRNLVQRLRSDCEMEEETDVAALAPASWHSQVPSGWLSTLARDVDEQQRLVSFPFLHLFRLKILNFTWPAQICGLLYFQSKIDHSERGVVKKNGRVMGDSPFLSRTRGRNPYQMPIWME